MEFPDDLKYTEDHEWVRVDGETAHIGITAYAASELGDIVYVDIETIGDELKQGDVFGSVEAVKTVSDLLLPLSGTVETMNEDLEDAPEIVNEDPYGKGWMITMTLSNSSELDGLMDAATYKESLGA